MNLARRSRNHSGADILSAGSSGILPAERRGMDAPRTGRLEARPTTCSPRSLCNLRKLLCRVVRMDTKDIDRITDHESGQMMNHLRITELRLGVILNFKHAKFEWECIVV